MSYNIWKETLETVYKEKAVWYNKERNRENVVHSIARLILSVSLNKADFFYDQIQM